MGSEPCLKPGPMYSASLAVCTPSLQKCPPSCPSCLHLPPVTCLACPPLSLWAGPALRTLLPSQSPSGGWAFFPRGLWGPTTDKRAPPDAYATTCQGWSGAMPACGCLLQEHALAWCHPHHWPCFLLSWRQAERALLEVALRTLTRAFGVPMVLSHWEGAAPHPPASSCEPWA